MTLTPEREQQLLALIGRVEELEKKRYLEELPEIATDGIVFPGKSKYNGLDDFINNTMSSGLISGCTVTDNSDGTVAVTSGYGYIRKTSDEIGELLAFSVPADSSVDLTDDSLNYVYVDYNSGNPTISYTTDVTSLDHTSQFVIALVYQESDHAHIAHAGQHLNNFIHNVYYYLWEVAGKERASGLVVSEDASEDRALNMTAGVLYWALQRLSVSALDTSTDGDNDEMTLFYRAAPSGWTEVTAQHVIPNTQYDDGSGTLQDLTPNRYGVYWVYVTIDGELYVQYGQGDYTLAQAEAAAAPTTMDELNGVGVLIAKIVIQNSAANFYEVYLPWSADIGSTPATDHGSLAGLGDDDHTQYLLANGDRSMTGTLFMDELAAADADSAGKGQFWVKNETPNKPYFTDDAGTDFDLIEPHASDGGAITISSGTATLAADHGKFTIAAQADTWDVLDTLSGMSSGDIVLLIADSGDTIKVEHGTGNIECPAAHDCILTDSQYVPFYYDGTNYYVVGRQLAAQEVNTTKTINLDNTMTTAEIQQIIDSTDHFIAPGEILTFQFADGTYTLTDTLSFYGFYGGGYLWIQGNSTEDGDGLHTDQAVILDFDATDCRGITIQACFCPVTVAWLRVDADTDSGNDCIRGVRSPAVKIDECYFKGNGFTSTGGSCIRVEYAISEVFNTYVSNAGQGIYCRSGVMFSSTNDETGTDPKYGLRAFASDIKKYSTQPAGSTANELESAGGKIE